MGVFNMGINTEDNLIKEMMKKKREFWKKYPNFTNLPGFELLSDIHQLQLKFAKAETLKKVFEIVDNFWEQGKKVRVVREEIDTNIMEARAINEFDYKQWEELTQKLKDLEMTE
jgi:hypothetical protein